MKILLIILSITAIFLAIAIISVILPPIGGFNVQVNWVVPTVPMKSEPEFKPWEL